MTYFRADCELCRAVRESTSEHAPALHNTCLYQTEWFAVLPALGPLVPGHIMVVSHDHYPNLLSMPREALVEYERLAQWLRDRSPYQELGFLEAEHGSTSAELAGGCIVHTHVNWIPGAANFIRIFDDRFQTTDWNRLSELEAPTKGYILLRSSTNERRFFVPSEKLPSQLLRREIFAQRGRDDWDWAAFPRQDWTANTVEMWRKHRASES